MPSQPPDLLCHYRYDPLDRLINQIRPGMPTHRRFYCKNRLATEIQEVMKNSVVQHGDLLLAELHNQDESTVTSLLATDLQRSVLQTLKANNQRQTTAYSPYGHRSAENGLASLLGFNGERPDPVTGYYLLGNGYRAFDPGSMRFNSPDSLSPFGKGGLNSYAYCLADPVNNEDPSGKITKTIASQWLTSARANLALAPEARFRQLADYEFSTLTRLRYKTYMQHLAVSRGSSANTTKTLPTPKSASSLLIEKMPTIEIDANLTKDLQTKFKPLLESLYRPNRNPTYNDLDWAAEEGFYFPPNAAPDKRTYYPATLAKEYKNHLPTTFPTQANIKEQLKQLKPIRQG